MTLTGRTPLLAALGLLAVVVHPTLGTVALWLLLVLALVGLDLLLAPPPTALQMRRLPIAAIPLGESSVSELIVLNTGRRTVRGTLRDGWMPSAGSGDERSDLILPPGEQRLIRTELTPTRRGDRQADRVTVRLRGPLGLAARQQSVHVPGTVRALPAFPSRKHLPSRLDRLRQLDGRSAVRIRGQGTEFDSLRDYVDGDDVRSIDWRATARRQHPVVRTWQPERDRRLLIVLDTSRTSAGRIGDTTRLDAGMDAALLLGALASQAGDKVHLLAGDRRVRARVRGSNSRSELLHDLVTAMAPLEPELVEAGWRTLLGADGNLPRHRSLIVLITPLEPAALEEGLLPVLPLLTARHRVVIASVSDPGVQQMALERSDADEVYAAAAAERTILLRQRTSAALERLGVTVLDEPPDVLPLALVDHYLMLKGRGLL